MPFPSDRYTVNMTNRREQSCSDRFAKECKLSLGCRAQEAAWNVVSRVVDDHDLGPQVEVLARHFAAGAPRVHAATKALRAFGLWRDENARRKLGMSSR